jgi:hypothetical protein
MPEPLSASRERLCSTGLTTYVVCLFDLAGYDTAARDLFSAFCEKCRRDYHSGVKYHLRF